MAYNARTGITTYKEADPAANPQADVDAAPSTATSLAPSPAPASQPLFDASAYQSWLPSADSWFTGHNVAPLAYMVSNGIPLPQEVHDALVNFINTQGGVGGVSPSASDSDIFGHWIATVQDKEAGPSGLFGGGGFLGTGLSFGNDNIDQLLNYGQGAMTAGNIGGTLATGDFSTDALQHAALSDAGTLGSAALGPAVSGFAGGGMLGAAAGGAAGGALSGLLRGGDAGSVAQGALAGAATAGGTRLAGQAFANFFPSEAPDMPSTATSFADASDPMKRGMLPLLAQADTGTMMDVNPDLGEIANSKIADLIITNPDGTLAQDLPGVMSATDSQILGPIATQKALEQAGFYFDLANGVYVPNLNGPGPSEQPKPPTLEEQRVQQAQKTIERLSKFGRALANLNGGRGQPEGAPQRQEGQSDTDYAQSLVEYVQDDTQGTGIRLGAPPDGVAPGTPEYLEWVQGQLDGAIESILGDTNPDAKDLEAQLRSKTREELDALERALFVRGQLGQLMHSGRYTDPFTGIGEDVIVPQGSLVTPGVAAYHRGLARTASELAGLSPDDLARAVGDFTARTPDLYGLQARQDARTLAEQLAMQDIFSDPDMKRRRYEMATSPESWLQILDQMSPAQLQALLASFGGR